MTARKNAQTEYEPVKKIKNILKICPIENLYCMQDLVLDLLEGRPVDFQAKKELKMDGQTYHFQEDIYMSLMKRLGLTSDAGKKFVSSFLRMGKDEYEIVLNELKKPEPDWESIQNGLNKKQSALSLLLGTCMSIKELFSSNVTVQEHYFISKKKPFWSELEDRASAAVRERFARAKDDEEKVVARWVNRMEELLCGLLLESENLSSLREWENAWIMVKEKLKYTDGNCNSEKEKRKLIDEKYIHQEGIDRIELLKKFLNNWEVIMTTTASYKQLQKILEMKRMGEESVKRARDINRLIDEKGGQVDDEVYEVAKKVRESAEELGEKLVNSLTVENAIKQWIPDYKKVTEMVVEKEKNKFVLSRIMEVKEEYERKGRFFLQELLQCWPIIEKEKATELKVRLSQELKNYADQEGLIEKLIEYERVDKKNTAKKEDTILNKAPSSWIEDKALSIRLQKKQIHPEVAKWIASDAEGSLCFYLGWVYDQLTELIPEYLIKFLQKSLQEYEPNPDQKDLTESQRRR